MAKKDEGLLQRIFGVLGQVESLVSPKKQAPQKMATPQFYDPQFPEGSTMLPNGTPMDQIKTNPDQPKDDPAIKQGWMKQPNGVYTKPDGKGGYLSMTSSTQKPPKQTQAPAPEGKSYTKPVPKEMANMTLDDAQRNAKLYDWFASQTPKGQKPEEYFPMVKQIPYMTKKEKQYNRPGLATLLALQSFYESSAGRANPTNPFGAKPGGTKQASLASAEDAIDYQTSKAVLGGGVGDSLDILSLQGQIKPEEIQKIYKSYNPDSPYVKNLMSAYKDIEGF